MRTLNVRHFTLKTIKKPDFHISAVIQDISLKTGFYFVITRVPLRHKTRKNTNPAHVNI